MKDKISVKENGVRVLKQKQLLQSTVYDCYEKFRLQHPDIQISYSSFAKLRPHHCVLIGSSTGMHNVCCCVYHDNPKLMITSSILGEHDVFNGLISDDLKDKLTSEKVLRKLVCPNPKDECWLSTCKDCEDNDSKLLEELNNILQSLEIESVGFIQWEQIDRDFKKAYRLDAEKFAEAFVSSFHELKLHDFIAKEQARYCSNLKENLPLDTCLIIMDYAENYSGMQKNCKLYLKQAKNA